MPNTCNNDLVIISTRSEIDAVDWSEYLLKHWSQLMGKSGSKLLVLAGIHGNDTEGLGRRDPDLVGDSEGQLSVIRSELEQEISDNNIKMEVVDIGNYYQGQVNGALPHKVDETSLLRAIKEKEPTVVILAFCYSGNKNTSPLMEVLTKTHEIDETLITTRYCKRSIVVV